MKIQKFNIRTLLLLFAMGLLIFNACNKDDDNYPRTRLFQPVLNVDLYSVDNTIIIDLGKMKAATSYTIELSRDSFKTATPEYSFNTTSNYVEVNSTTIGEDLLWYTIYQVRATAHADDPAYDSKVSDLGSVRTQKFPSNQGAPTLFDVLDSRARVFWTQSGAPITKIKVYAIDDLRLKTPLLQFDVTDADRLVTEKIIGGLSPSTKYQIAIYSEDKVRGWEIYSTREPLVSGDKVIDLTGIDKTSILADTLADVAAESIILLDGGKTYTTGGYKFDKSLTIMAGYSFTPALPLIDCSSNFGILGGSTFDYIRFVNIAFSADMGANYVFNPSESSSTPINVGEIKYDGCQIRKLRGISRFRGAGTIGSFIITNSVCDSIGSYGILTLDTDKTIFVDNIVLENSTFSKIDVFIVNRTNSQSVVIESCTFSEAPSNSRQIFRWRGSTGFNDVVNGIKIHNTIWGHTWDMSNSGIAGADGFDGLPNTNFDVLNCYSTSDFLWAVGKDEIPGFPVANYSGPAGNLWVNPYTGVDFNIKDGAFAGKGDCGDPRWRIGL